MTEPTDSAGPDEPEPTDPAGPDEPEPDEPEPDEPEAPDTVAGTLPGAPTDPAEMAETTGSEPETKGGPEVEASDGEAQQAGSSDGPSPTAEAEPDGPGPSGRWPRVARVAAAAGVVLIAGVWAWRASRDDEAMPELTPAETISVFFDAQAAGDCETVLDVVTEASWSQDGAWSRSEFLDHCRAALVGYRPTVDAATLPSADQDGSYEDVDSLQVTMDRPLRPAVMPEDAPDNQGALRREDGQWRVEVDPNGFILGRTVDDTLQGYIAAYNAGDCAAMPDFLAEPTWSQDGELSEDEFVERCSELLGGRGSGAEGRSTPLTVDLGDVRPDRDDPDRGRGAVYVRRLNNYWLGREGWPGDAVVFVRDRLTWQLAGIADDSSGSDDAPIPGTTGAPVPQFGWVEIQDRLLDIITTPDDECTFYTDGPAAQPDDGTPLPGVQRDFDTCFHGVELTVQAFDDDEAAREAAAAAVADAVERSAGDSGLPGVETPVHGVDGALGVCSTDGCASAASAHAVRDGVLVSVAVIDPDAGVADAAAILRAQLERL